MMTLKAQSEMHYLRTTRSANLSAKRQEVQDWTVLWVFNHLFSGAEAFVAAHLQDFPKDLKLRAFPGGVGISLPLPQPLTRPRLASAIPAAVGSPSRGPGSIACLTSP